mmetsp:Transcript_11870/g.35903  ORF Transcript_11870/g.35903 Transcript_11870/m.35903 type:complete len:313 (-) Transcript_11870:323-1261(-)
MLCVLPLPSPARAAPAPALVQPALVQCPTPGCNTPLRPGRVAAHLLRCPVLAEIRRQEAQTWFVRGVNTGEGGEDEPEEPLTMEAASLLEASLERRSGTLWHAPASSALPDGLGVNERKRERHRLQRRAIAEQLAELGALGRGRCIVELGAGNGELSLAVAEAHRDAVRSDTLVLLDQGSKPKGRSGHGRLAADTALEGHFASVTRLKASLESTGWPLCGRDGSACVRVAGWTRARRPRGAARGGRAVLVRAGGPGEAPLRRGERLRVARERRGERRGERRPARAPAGDLLPPPVLLARLREPPLAALRRAG